MIFQKYGNMKFAYRNREFWCKGYYVVHPPRAPRSSGRRNPPGHVRPRPALRGRRPPCEGAPRRHRASRSGRRSQSSRPGRSRRDIPQSAEPPGRGCPQPPRQTPRAAPFRRTIDVTRAQGPRPEEASEHGSGPPKPCRGNGSHPWFKPTDTGRTGPVAPPEAPNPSR